MSLKTHWLKTIQTSACYFGYYPRHHALFALQLPRMRFDNNNFRFIPESDPARIADAEMAKIFGDSVPLLIGIQRKYSTVVDREFLQKCRSWINSC